MEPSSIITFLRHQRHMSDPVYVASVALAIYDYILTLHLEVKYIWFSRWTYTKVLFLLIRYMTFANMIVTFYGQLFLNTSVNWCKWTNALTIWGICLKAVLAEIILCVRTWAIWRRERVIAMVLLVPMLLYSGLSCYLSGSWLHSLQIENSPYPGFRGCFWTNASNTLWVQYASLFGVEAIVLTLMVISAFRLYRMGCNSELSLIIHRDGILFYFYLLVLTGANIYTAQTSVTTDKNLLPFLDDVLYSVFTTRIVLNIRSVGNGQGGTELHTFQSSLPPIHFASNEDHRNFTIIDDGALESQQT